MSCLERKLGIKLKQDDLVINKEKISYEDIVKWLIKDYFSIYYVNLLNDNYIEYSSDDDSEHFEIVQSGQDFFKDSIEAFRKGVHPDDFERVVAFYKKDNIINSLEHSGSIPITYRINIDGKTTYINSTIDYARGDKNHLLICLKNVDSAAKWQKEYEASLKQDVSYSSIAASLAKDYFVIYYVNIIDGEFIEYGSNVFFKQLKIKYEGDSFYEAIWKVLNEHVYADDLDKVRKTLYKEKLLEELDKNKTYVVNFRIMYNGGPRYVRMKALKLGDDDSHIVIGMSDIDEQVKRDEAYNRALQMASRDALTGVKSKYAYDQTIDKLEKEISDGSPIEFAVAVCDVNNLKSINDSKGHQEGDKYLCTACQIVCDVFKHSPVFRIGGDEFAAILRGGDYVRRFDLLKEINDIAKVNTSKDAAVMACGMSDYQKGDKFADVFNRADEAMYAQKNSLKGIANND